MSSFLTSTFSWCYGIIVIEIHSLVFPFEILVVHCTKSWMCNVVSCTEEVPESYWKELAEQRRIALNDSLHENEMVGK